MFVLEELHKRFLLGENGCNQENCVGFNELALDYFKDCYPHKLSQKEEINQNMY